MRKLPIFIGAVAVMLLAGCSSDVDPSVGRNACLWEAVRAYPSWDTNNGPLLEHVESCKGQDTTEIRQLMMDFVEAANRNSAKEN